MTRHQRNNYLQTDSFKYTWMNRITGAFAYSLVSVIILGGTSARGGSTVQVLMWYSGLVIYVVGMVRMLSIGITIRTDSFVIRNVFRTHRIHLSEVASVEWAPKYELSQLRIRLTDGHVVTPTATKIQGPKDGGLDAAYAMRRKLHSFRGDPMPPPPGEMMRLGKLPPPPVGSGRE